ncbi:MAG: response regulator [Candidatus Latescibacteria bacterium]|nr:response regulator [bacterium]MBD3423041.1 response regulator [Candidatus Latescibacterota bacterium]
MNRRRVIIADCSQNLLEGIRGLLRTVFDSVVMVADLDSLLDAASRMKADLVVLDLSLGTNRCGEAVKAVKKSFPGIKVLVMSLHDEQGAVQAAVSAGADGFVLKRSAASDLLPAVEKILAGKTFFSVNQDN